MEDACRSAYKEYIRTMWNKGTEKTGIKPALLLKYVDDDTSYFREGWGRCISGCFKCGPWMGEKCDNKLFGFDYNQKKWQLNYQIE